MAAKDSSSVEYVRVQNYLNTERWITRSRWFAIGFLVLFVNLLPAPGWPRGLINSLLGIAALYNLGIDLYLRSANFFSIRMTLLFLGFDMAAVAVGLYHTGGISSPFLFIWHLTLFVTGFRFGFARSLPLLAPMSVFYAYLVQRDMGLNASDAVHRLLLGLASLAAATLYGTIFSRGERYTMQAMAGFRAASITDHLTGLHNYFYFMDRLKHEQYRADRSQSHFSIIIFDLDRFKKVNDTYGHEKGNLLLKEIAGIIASNARRMDTVARYGGEEFVILMPDSRGAELEVAERIRQKIENTEFTGISDQPLRITVSGGICTYPYDAATVEDALTAADLALYTAKARGRNTVHRCGGCAGRPA